MNDPDWWRAAVVYQIYLRSFADGNGDGLADGGYDVDDYRDIDPRVGTLADFDVLVKTLHGAGVKVMTDLGPNHTSERHAWFLEGLTAGRGSAACERHHFRDGAGPDGSEPPNDWQSIFGGPAWQQVEDGQWYLHVFAPEQPDLNWKHPEISEPYLPHTQMTPDASPPGAHPWWDRDEVPDRLRTAVDQGLARAAESGSANAWTLSNHDVVRHASRYGFAGGTPASAAAWLLTDGREPVLDGDLGVRRARAAALFMLALPGAAYLYQGEELGLHEVADLPPEVLQDPAWVRSGHTVKGRDGCRVPLPWTPTGSSFGLSSGGSHLPQPGWFGPVSVEAQATDPASTLSLYRQALGLRRTLAAGPELGWLPAPADLLHFRRPGGWHCLTWFGDEALPLADTWLPPRSYLLLSSSADRPGDHLPPVSSTWWQAPDDERTT